MESIYQDLKYGLRTLFKHPCFSLIAVLSLALGIGANASIFSLVYAALIKPLPFKDPDRLVMVYTANPKSPEKQLPWSYPKFEVLRANSEAFEGVAAFSSQNFPLTDTEDPERLQTELVSANYFPLLGVGAAIGRVFLEEEDKTPGTHPVALIGHSLWKRRFASDPNIIGKTINLNKVELTIAGVLPEGFRGQNGNAEIWAPMMIAPALTFPRRLTSAHAHWHDVIARLKPDATQAQAQAATDTVVKKIEEAIPWPAQWGPRDPEAIKVASLREAKVDPAIRKSFLVLFGAVGFVLLIACANIANLLLGKAVSRRKEIAVRIALGASRMRIVRQLLTESILLSLTGGALGLIFTLWGVEFLSSIRPASGQTFSNSYIQMLDLSAPQIDSAVLGFSLLLSLATGLLFGLIPALQASRTDLNESLKESGAGSFSIFRFRSINPRSVLVVAELALSVVLLAGAGLLIRSFAQLQAVPIGFEPDNLLTLKVHLPKYSEAAETAFYEQLLNRIKALPGVKAASVASSAPLSSNSTKTTLKIKDRPEGSIAIMGAHSVSPDHFKTLRIPLIKGRALNDQDRAGSRRVAIVSEEAVRRFWPNEDPLGKQIQLGVGWENEDFAEIVGVVGDVKYGNVEQAVEPDVYIPYLQPPAFASIVTVRAEGDPLALVSSLRRTVLEIDKNVPLYDIRTMQDLIADASSGVRFSALLLAVFAAAALILSAMGIYGVMSYAVSGRVREIAIRIALGAQRKDVLKMIVGDAIILIALGLLLGLMGAFASSGILSSQLYGVGERDPITFAIVSALLAAVALAACCVPARRAAKVDPIVALRCE